MKFRIWYDPQTDSYRPRFLKDGDWTYFLSQDGNVVANSPASNEMLTLNHCTVEPYVGSQDSQSRLIYENDIVQYSGKWAGDIIRGVVRWSENKFIVDCCSSGFKETPLNQWLVIGNMNETPELL